MRQNTLLIASLLIGLQFIILILTLIFDRQQQLLVSKIESNNQDLTSTQQKIAEQRDLVALQNQRLKEAQDIIETQNIELLSKNEGLEAEIEKRTRELMDYNQQLEQFAFIASHNLRAPIARILGLGNLLKVSNEPADEIPIKQNLINAAIELDHIVKDINMILKIRKNNEAIFEELEVQRELDMILSSLSKDVENTQAVITINIACDKIRTVRPYFNSIVYNLLSNAIKYRKLNERPTIEFTVTPKDNFACIMVKDNGLGFESNSVKDKLFTLYSRFHDHVEGKGIGLYLIKTQAEILNGYVEVESQEGVGSVFRVFIKTE
jgi:light-regulated signal transduction histidine kinase (bacteriophytochrome)